MKLKQKYTLVLALSLPLTASIFSFTSAQKKITKMPSQQKQHVLVNAYGSSDNKFETLSGIHLYPAKKGTYELNFSQDLKENGVLEIKNRAGKIVYQKSVSISSKQSSWRYNVGKLRPDTYLIEVKTSDTTYWTKFKVGK
ncbi:hypothetical protein GCM10023188_11680 [Pontibacter saemangeumensis]|uniref:Por secretion system C-terminal sorting domain-containing protein n=1 Tax=Pontibacter saemangeumensis TaxID=1084525 RepID=A0ABP8LE46_9BACT